MIEANPVCNRCGVELEIGMFPFCRGNPIDHVGGTFNVIQDSIEGGVWIKHGLCNEDGSPRKYYSKTEINAEAKRRGLVNIVEHACEPGTDKAQHTTRWF